MADPDAALLKRSSVKEKPIINYGIIIYQADSTNGTWYYSRDNQTTAVNSAITDASTANAYILTQDTYIRFDPAYNRNINNITIQCRGFASVNTILNSSSQNITINTQDVNYTSDFATLSVNISHLIFHGIPLVRILRPLLV